MSKSQSDAWATIVRDLAAERGLNYDPVGGLNPRDAPAALCPGGSNRLTGELVEGFWGASCDAMEREVGGLFRKSVVPGAVLVKAHLPDLPEAVDAFDVESIEARPEDQIRRHSRNRVQFESIEFNQRFIATVPADHDPIALRELFSPAFLEWATTIDQNVDFGASERQMYFMWRLPALDRESLERALENAAELFRRLRRELEEANVVTFPPGPWNAGLEHFPAGRGADAGPTPGRLDPRGGPDGSEGPAGAADQSPG